MRNTLSKTLALASTLCLDACQTPFQFHNLSMDPPIATTFTSIVSPDLPEAHIIQFSPEQSYTLERSLLTYARKKGIESKYIIALEAIMEDQIPEDLKSEIAPDLQTLFQFADRNQNLTINYHDIEIFQNSPKNWSEIAKMYNLAETLVDKLLK